MPVSNVARLPAPKREIRRSTERHPLPQDFILTPELRTWAKLRQVMRLDERFEHFTDIAAARGYEYADWSAAFRTACRDDWAKFGKAREVLYCCRCTLPITGGSTRRDAGLVCGKCE